MGREQPGHRRLLHARLPHRRTERLPAAGPRRGPRLLDPDHGRPGLLAGRERGRHPDAADGPAREEARGNPQPRLRQELHQARPGDHLRLPEGVDAERRDRGHLVPGPQEDQRHPDDVAEGRGRAFLQRRVRRRLRHRLRHHLRRLHAARGARLRRDGAGRVPALAGRRQGRDLRRPGREGVPELLAAEARQPRPEPRAGARGGRRAERRGSLRRHQHAAREHAGRRHRLARCHRRTLPT